MGSIVKVMVSNNTDNIDKETIMDWLVKSLKLCGKITIHTEKESAMQIKADTNRINIDILRPELFKLEADGEAYEKGEEGRMDKLKDKLNATREAMKKLKNSERDFIDILDIPKEFTQRLTDNNMTIVLSRKGKEAIILGVVLADIGDIIAYRDGLHFCCEEVYPNRNR